MEIVYKQINSEILGVTGLLVSGGTRGAGTGWYAVPVNVKNEGLAPLLSFIQ
jgi:hypothetical protein